MGAVSESERFALRAWKRGRFKRQNRQLIIAERGAPLKAQRRACTKRRIIVAQRREVYTLKILKE